MEDEAAVDVEMENQYTQEDRQDIIQKQLEIVQIEKSQNQKLRSTVFQKELPIPTDFVVSEGDKV